MVPILRSDGSHKTDIIPHGSVYCNESNVMNFPEDWPKFCPPDDAQSASGIYFRVGRSNPPNGHDFKSQAELGRAINGDECLRLGLSTLRDLTDADHLVRLNPRLGSVIYKGELNDSHGKSKLTSSRRSPSHTTWWACSDVDRLEPFSVVEV